MTLDPKNIVSIADLDVTQTPRADIYVQSVVALQWPYSSSSGVAAFLLAEPNPRLRRAGGQIRWEVIGPSAKAIASSGIAIGDVVRLSMSGARWVELPGHLSTPGRYVAQALQFDRVLVVEVE